MSIPRVLLVEDDASLRRFVRMVLEDLPLELVECDSVSPALEELSKGRFQLILTDLMMPGVSGLGLLETLKATPALQGDAKVVVLSAGLTAAMRMQLEPMGLWRLLHKPVSVTELEDCVNEALADNTTLNASVGPIAGEALHNPTTSPLNDMDLSPAQDRLNAIEIYFDGDMELFEDYRSGCLEQFRDDVQAGDAAAQASDMPALQRLAHSLKTVLLTLGYTLASTQAKDLETHSRSNALEAAQTGWRTLREALQAIQRAG